jgi:phosphate transport system permease protein
MNDVSDPIESWRSATTRGQRPPGSRDVAYRSTLGVVLFATAAVIVWFIYTFIVHSVPGWQLAGWKFFTSTTWDYGAGQYGVLPLVLGTLVTTGLALVLATPIALGSALAVVFILPRKLRLAVASLLDLLAVVPSVVYGVWGSLVMGRWFDYSGEPWLRKLTSGHWPFSGPINSQGIMPGSIVLAVMILPTIAAVTRDVFASVPAELIEGSLSLGATRGQVLRKVVIPTSKVGIFGAIILGTGRALGETVALFLLLGGVTAHSPLPTNLFATASTLATEIVNDYGDASGGKLGVIFCLALMLMILVGVVNFSARLIVRRSARQFS